jgi:serine phosphatase RsbU (regulator of sigma subunit)
MKRGLGRAHEQFSAVTTGAGDHRGPVPVEVDSAGVITSWSAEAEEASGRTAADAVGMGVVELIVDERRRAATANVRLERLQRIARAVSVLLTPARLASVLVDEVGPTLGAVPLLWVITADGSAVELVEPEGQPAPVSYGPIPLDSDVPLPIVVRTGEPIYVTGRAQRKADFPSLHGVPADAAFGVLPLIMRDQVTGALAIGYGKSHEFGEDEREFLTAVSNLIAVALERAHMREAERRSTERLTFLAEASTVLASSLDYTDTLAQVVRLMVPRLAGMATIHVYDDRGELRRVALAHRDPEIESALLNYVDEHEYAARSEFLVAATKRGRSIVLPDATGVLAQQKSVDVEHTRLLDSLGIRSSVLVPLTARGETLGVLTLLRVGDENAYSAEDETLATEVAQRASIAVDNARLHARRTEVADLLQSSLLPPALPSIPGVELAAAYYPAGEGIDAGGDFYDVFPLREGMWALMVGDVTGTGPIAAALTAQVRHTARAVAGVGADPATVVGAVNAALLTGTDAERFCTMIFATVRPHDSGIDVELVNCGHPYPLVIQDDGRSDVVEAGGPLLGVIPDVAHTSLTIRLAPSDALLLYTDGVIESRADGRGDYFDEAGLRAAATGPGHRPAKDIVADIEAALHAFTGGRLADDIAILAMRTAVD